MTQPQQGLYPKFEVTRTDGDPTGKHANCRHFVIDVDHDLVGQSALLIYAASIDNPQLTADLMALLRDDGPGDPRCWVRWACSPLPTCATPPSVENTSRRCAKDATCTTTGSTTPRPGERPERNGTPPAPEPATAC